jgi:hypothetical protein
MASAKVTEGLLIDPHPSKGRYYLVEFGNPTREIKRRDSDGSLDGSMPRQAANARGVWTARGGKWAAIQVRGG